ncbi:Hypothetical predicted protein [Olea europaea subsp. europaea]|uniref:Uncharacterized protein n=1 Tax=Olea europaea subsp. europaea TaxID=158383 RepID=A0A8S0U5F8_OLEEU|nr:Hypothetical predicted protein [Olea europaea subsp. europaea]
MQYHLQRLPGYDKWAIEKETGPHIEAFQDQKEKLGWRIGTVERNNYEESRRARDSNCKSPDRGIFEDV